MTSQPFGYLTLTTTTMPPSNYKCFVCGGVAVAMVCDWTEVELDVLIEPSEHKPMCFEHNRPSRVYFLDGSVKDVMEVQREMYDTDERRHSSFDLAQEDR